MSAFLCNRSTQTTLCFRRSARIVIPLFTEFEILQAGFFYGVSVLTSAAISVDRLLALLLGLRYRHVVTLRRVRVVIICFRLIGASLGSTWTNQSGCGKRHRHRNNFFSLNTFSGNFDFLLRKDLLQTATSKS